MLIWSLIFLIIAAVAAIFAFRRPPSTLVYIAKLIFYVSITIFIVMLFGTILSSAPPTEREANLLQPK
ncbi:DUF1328 family protein [Legionella cardiaca]|uniref:UPF0391 membrane protein PXX05_11630 n=1 Tax=Legionella cardiaca TaxID=1071983 RepID=A0ABY8AQ39_9GAMM|nr:DUF1328 family protein [Legionella cardiaca]WED42554.1 DUF1328 domain-containing protein [Legionella cardiaca]